MPNGLNNDQTVAAHLPGAEQVKCDWKCDWFYVAITADKWAIFERSHKDKSLFAAVAIVDAPGFKGTPLLNPCAYWRSETAREQSQQEFERFKAKWRDLPWVDIPAAQPQPQQEADHA